MHSHLQLGIYLNDRLLFSQQRKQISHFDNITEEATHGKYSKIHKGRLV